MTTTTIEEHAQHGAQLYAVRETLLACSVRSKSMRSAVLARQALKRVDALRDELDDQLCREHPDAWSGDIYYPGAKASA